MTAVPLTLKRLPTATYVDTAVLSKGDVEGHGFHGNQHTGGIGGGTTTVDKPAHIEFIEKQVRRFQESGGTIERLGQNPEKDITTIRLAQSDVNDLKIDLHLSGVENVRLSSGLSEMSYALGSGTRFADNGT